MSLDQTTSYQPRARSGPDGSDGFFSKITGPTERTFQKIARSPRASLPMGGGRNMVIYTDRVRAKPAISPSLSMNLGINAIGLGIWGTLFPSHVKKTFGIRAPEPVVQAVFGARELWSGYSLAGDPTKTEVLWARVAGDVFDIVALKSLDNADNPKRGNARAALGVVLAVTALDLIAAVRMSNVKRDCQQGA
jgi:hypothetical protein